MTTNQFSYNGIRIKDVTVEALDRYARARIPTGSFLRAVLANDLMMAAARADDENALSLTAICSYVHNQLPSGSHGSYEIVDAWIETGRLMRAAAKAENPACGPLGADGPF